jgi:hypothetical protein
MKKIFFTFIAIFIAMISFAQQPKHPQKKMATSKHHHRHHRHHHKGHTTHTMNSQKK